jgi:hypothetical protein
LTLHHFRAPITSRCSEKIFTSAVGLVYLDVTDWEVTEQEVSTAIPNRPAAPPLSAQVPSGLSAAARAELQQAFEYGSTGFADIRALRVPSGLPVAVLIRGMPPGRLPPNAPPIDLKMFAGLFMLSSQAGHQVVQEGRYPSSRAGLTLNPLPKCFGVVRVSVANRSISSGARSRSVKPSAPQSGRDGPRCKSLRLL